MDNGLLHDNGQRFNGGVTTDMMMKTLDFMCDGEGSAYFRSDGNCLVKRCGAAL